ncbi:spermidine synthase, partial [Bradyrhizobium sp.]
TSGGIGNLLPLTIALALHLGCFFVIGMVCHGELAKRRPPTARLTEFYFFVSLSGVVGGIFNALIAPVVFTSVWEYPLALIAACLARPRMPADDRSNLMMDIVLPLLLAAALLAGRAILIEGAVPGPLSMALLYMLYLLPALVLVKFSQRRWRFGIAVALLLLFQLMPQKSGKQVAAERSFFGVHKVELIDDAEAPALLLMNGTTLHGAKSLRPNEATQPLTYYSKEGPFGRFFAVLSPVKLRQVAVIGLGTGALACYAGDGQDWTFYEIDAAVEHLAREHFQFLQNCAPRAHVVLGDARMTIENAPDGTYDALIVDAFSSDSVPMHLITREALAIYLRKLAPGGHLLLHISSRRLDLTPVVAALTADAVLPARILFDDPTPGTPVWRRSPALVVIVVRQEIDLDAFTSRDGWAPLPKPESRHLWTDQRADLLRVIRY